MGQQRQGQHSAAPRRTVLGHVRRTPTAVVVGLAVLLTAGVAGTVASATDAPAPAASRPTAFPTLTVTAPAPAPAPAPKPAAKSTARATTKKKPAKKLTLAELRAEIARVDAELDRRTLLVEQSTAAMTDARRRLAETRTASVRARLDANRAHIELGRYAAAAYRGQQLSPMVTVLMGPPAGAEQTLRNLQNLEQAADIKTDIAGYAAETAARAATLERQAVVLANESAAATLRLKAARESARQLAVTTQKRFDAEVKRLIGVRARLAAKECNEKGALAPAYPNGMIPTELLCSIGVGAHAARGDAAVGFRKLAAAYKKDLGTPIVVNSAYRTRAHQASLYAADPVMVARPGRSHHGLGLAFDLGGGIQNFGSEQHVWMQENAARFGFFHPDWAQQNGSMPEPWHWEFKVATYPSNDGAPAVDGAAHDEDSHASAKSDKKSADEN